MAVMIMVVVFTVGMGISALTVNNLKLAQRDKNTAVAFNIAESGAERAIRWLKDQGTAAVSITTTDPFSGSVSFNGGTYQVTISTYASDAGSALKRFKIVSTGTYLNVTERVEVITRQQSFGMFAYFTDQETSSISSGRIWFASTDRIRGPAHSNNASSSNFQINWGGSTGAIFQGILSSVASSITYSPSRPTTEAQFESIYQSGSHGYLLGVDSIPLPATTDSQKVAAWGASTGFPTASTGVYTPTGGGIYIRGDSTITMSVGTGGTQVFTIVQGTTTTVVTVNFQTGVTTRKVGTAAATTVTGGNSGVIYSSGSITSLSGVIADNILTSGAVAYRSTWTIATDVANSKNITLSNTLKHNTQLDFTQAMTATANLYAGQLGMIARNIIVASGAPTAMQIDAVMLAGSSSYSDGSFYVANYDSKSPTGTLRITGGIIQKARGPVGQLSGSNLQYGYAKDYQYDSRMAERPTPYFPITPNYDKLSWRRY